MIDTVRDHRGLEVLTRPECVHLLGRGGIGRVAVTIGALPAVFPVNYALDDAGDIVFRSSPGTKLTAALRGAVVAFEVDHFDAFAHSGWSVMVVGPAAVVIDAEENARLERLPLSPWAPSEEDVFVRICAEIVSGREIRHVAVPERGEGTLSRV